MTHPHNNEQPVSFIDRVVGKFAECSPTLNHYLVRQVITEAISESESVKFEFRLLHSADWRECNSEDVDRLRARNDTEVRALFTAPQPTAEVLAKTVDEQASRERMGTAFCDYAKGRTEDPYVKQQRRQGFVKAWELRDAEVLALQEQLTDYAECIESNKAVEAALDGVEYAGTYADGVRALQQQLKHQDELTTRQSIHISDLAAELGEVKEQYAALIAVHEDVHKQLNKANAAFDALQDRRRKDSE